MFLSQNPEWSFSPSSKRKLFQQKLYSYSLVFSSLRSRCCSTTCSILPSPMLSWSETHSTSPPMFNPRPPPTGLHLETKEWERETPYKHWSPAVSNPASALPRPQQAIPQPSPSTSPFRLNPTSTRPYHTQSCEEMEPGTWRRFPGRLNSHVSCPVNVRRAQPLPTGKKTGSYGTTVGKMGGDKGLEATAWRSGTGSCLGVWGVVIPLPSSGLMIWKTSRLKLYFLFLFSWSEAFHK